MRRGRRTSGFTLNDVLVCLGVIGILIALAIPAVQYAHETSRRLRCDSNLRQFGLAIHGYAAQYGVLPAGSDAESNPSIFIAMLPALDLQPLYHSVNFDFGSLSAPNQTASRTAMKVLLRPADVRVRAGDDPGWTNYAGNAGIVLSVLNQNGVFSRGGDTPCALAAITDGTSNTAAVADCLTGEFNPLLRDPVRSVFSTPVRFERPDELDLFASICRQLDIQNARPGGIWGGRGSVWMWGGYGHTLYNHIMTPNDHTCQNGGGYQEGVWTASSGHPSGLNLLFVDGHCRFIRSSVPLSIWRGLGTSNGGELISDKD